MAWESFNDIYVPNTGGSIEGDLEVSGNLTVNDGSGEGTTYDVASEITELKSAWDSVSHNKVLWSGGWYMNNSQTATLSEAISAQPHGIVLVFSYYNGDVTGDQNVTRFIPKYLIADGGTGLFCSNLGFERHFTKYLWITDTTITGHDNNQNAFTINGVTLNNASYVLWQVIGV